MFILRTIEVLLISYSGSVYHQYLHQKYEELKKTNAYHTFSGTSNATQLSYNEMDIDQKYIVALGSLKSEIDLEN